MNIKFLTHPRFKSLYKTLTLSRQYSQLTSIKDTYKGSDKLKGKVALITGGSSGIGRSIAVHYAREGADVSIAYLSGDQKGAEETQNEVEKEGKKCLLLPGDLRDKEYCKSISENTVKEFGKLNVLVNNAGVLFTSTKLEEISDEHLEATFDVNIMAMFRVTRAALKYLNEGDSIINASSMAAYTGFQVAADYSATKGAVTVFTRAMSAQLAERKIRVNCVAPGLIWTPMTLKTLVENGKKVVENTPLKRAGQPCDVATTYVMLASDEFSYYTGQSFHPNGGFTFNT